jgi:hypothetical protein
MRLMVNQTGFIAQLRRRPRLAIQFVISRTAVNLWLSEMRKVCYGKFFSGILGSRRRSRTSGSVSLDLQSLIFGLIIILAQLSIR